MKEDRLITVCSECLRACCWQGIFYCDEYKTAGTVERPVSELKEWALENPEYWENRPK